MAKITDYSKVTELTNDNVFLLDGQNGTKGILAIDLADGLNGFLSATDLTDGKDFNTLDIGGTIDDQSYALLIQPNTGNNKTLYKVIADDLLLKTIGNIETSTRKNTWRGKNLGTAVTTEQYNQIKAGTFEDLFLGDYWDNGITWRIVDFDYWLNTGDTPCTIHHLVIMPDQVLFNGGMNGSNTTAGGYLGCGVNKGTSYVEDMFGSEHILSHREFLTNAVTNGYPSGGAWVDSRVEIPSEIMIFGCRITSPSGNGTIAIYNETVDKTQLAGMRVNPELISPNGIRYWLRDVVDPGKFAALQYNRYTTALAASSSIPIRPVFGLTG